MGVLEYTFWINLDSLAVFIGPWLGWIAVTFWCYIVYRVWKMDNFDR